MPRNDRINSKVLVSRINSKVLVSTLAYVKQKIHGQVQAKGHVRIYVRNIRYNTVPLHLFWDAIM